jgi:hypothetical protein
LIELDVESISLGAPHCKALGFQLEIRMDQAVNAFNPTRNNLPAVSELGKTFTLTSLAGTQLTCRLGLPARVELVCEPAIDIDHLSAARNIELVLGSTRGALDEGHACTLRQCDLHGLLTADGTGEDRGQFLLHDSDDAATSTTHAVLTRRMGDTPLISTF